MELQFEKVGKRWVAEFEATGNFNLNVKRVKPSSIKVYQKGSANGEYASMASWDSKLAPSVIDYDFSALIYPKFIKVVSESEPIKGIVTMDSESGGSGAGGAKIVPLIDQCRVYWQNTMMGSHIEVRVPDENGQFINAPQAGGYLVVESPNLYLPTSSTNNHTWIWDSEIGGFRTEVFEAYETFSFSYIEGI